MYCHMDCYVEWMINTEGMHVNTLITCIMIFLSCFILCLDFLMRRFV